MAEPERNERPLFEKEVVAYEGGSPVRSILSVFPHRITLRRGTATKLPTGLSAFVQTEPEVVLIKARVAGPWFNTSLVLHGAGKTVVASMPGTGRRPLRHALAHAGFQLIESRTWFSLGGGSIR